MKELKNERIKGDTHKRFYCFLSARMTRNFTERIKQRLCKSVSSVPEDYLFKSDDWGTSTSSLNH